jgi:CheY-like chemotaxis protein/predicted DNA-binding transcriptional regulator AlpA
LNLKEEERDTIMTTKKLLTTGEVAQMLNISRSTVSRKFDKGVFFGQKNPITGERMISRESLTSFVEQYNLSLDSLAIEKKKILIGTSDEQLFSLLQNVFSEGKNIQLDRCGFGCDVLIRCSKDHPDLLLIDEELPDIPSAEVIKSLRRLEENKDLKILCCAKTSDTRQCLDWGADEALAREGLEEELSKKVQFLLNLPEERPAEAQSYEHQRRFPRLPIHVPAKIGVYRLRTPYAREAGKATMENISYGGSFLSDIHLEKGMIPSEPFRFLLEVDQPPLTNWRAHCKVVRLQSNGTLSAGVQFMRLSKANRKMLETISEHA